MRLVKSLRKMIDNMIVQSILARVIEAKLKPVFDAIKQAYDDGRNDG